MLKNFGWFEDYFGQNYKNKTEICPGTQSPYFKV